jgi:hypothetical protein
MEVVTLPPKESPMFFDNRFNASKKRLNEIKHQHELARRKTEREVCALVSSGNESLQQGEYSTQEDMDTLQNEMETFFSSKESEW